MSGPGASAVIGRVSVRILPDTSNFRREAEAQLSRIERRLEVTARVRVDTRQARDELKRSTEQIQRDLNEATRATVRIDTRHVQRDLDQARAASQRFVDKIRTQMNDVMRGPFAPDLDPAKFNAAMSKIEQRLERIEEIKASIKPDMDPLARQRALRQIDDLKRDIDNIQSKIKPEVSEPFVIRATTRLAILARDRFVTLIPRVSKRGVASVATTLAALSGARALKSLSENFVNFITNLDKSVPKIAGLSLAILGLAAGSLTAAANLAALSSSLASIGATSLALPGILGGMAVGAVITLVAFKDLKKEVPELDAAWKKIKKTISENFWAKAAKPIREMTDGLLPIFTKGFAKASTAIGGYFGSLATNLKTSLQPAVKGMFADLTKSIGIATGGTKSFANIITILGRVGAGYLPRLAKFFVDISDRFSAFLTRTEKSGELKKWIDNGIQALKDLGRAIKGVFNIFSGLNKAATAGGGSTLGIFADTLQRIAKVVNSPGFQAALSAVFQSAFEATRIIGKTAGPAITNLFKTLSLTLQSILPLVGQTLGLIAKTISDTLSDPVVQKGLVDLFQGIADGFKALAPGFRALAPLFGQIASFIGNFARDFGPVLSEAFKALAPPLTALLKGLEPVVDILSGVLVDAIKTIAPLLPDLAKAFVDIITPLAEAIAPIVKQTLPVFVDLIRTVLPLLPPLAKAFADLMVALAPVVAELAKAVVDFLKPLIPAIVDVLPIIVLAFKGWLEQLKPFLPVIRVVATILGILAAGPLLVIAAIVDGLSLVFRSLKTAIKNVGGPAKAFGKVIDALTAPLRLMAGLIGTVVNFIVGLLQPAFAGIKAVLSPVVDFFKTLYDAVDSLLGPLGSIAGAFGLLKAPLQAILNFARPVLDFLGKVGDFVTSKLGIGDSLAPKMQAQLDELKRLAGEKSRGVGIAVKDGLNVTQQVGAGITETGNVFKGGLDRMTEATRLAQANIRAAFNFGASKAVASGITDARSKLQVGLSDMKGDAQRTTKDLERILASTPMAKGLRQAISGGVAALRTGGGQAAGVASATALAIGNIMAAVSLSGAGSSIMDSLIGGIQSRRGALNSVLQGITADIPKKKGPPKTDAKLLYNNGRLIMQSLINGFESKRAKVGDYLTKITNEIARISKSTASRAVKTSAANIGRQANLLTPMLAKYDALTAKVGAATDRLNDLKKAAADYFTTIKNAVNATGNVTIFRNFEGSALTSFDAIIKGLTAARDRAKAFAAALAQLKKLGASQTLIDQIAQAGSNDGLNAAQAILEKGKAGVKAVNDLQASLASYAGQAAKTATDSMYQAGINAAKGLLDGLLKNRRQLEAQMAQLAQSLVKVVKRELKIKSPSRVFMAIGGHIGNGLLIGLESTYDSVHKSLRSFGDDLSNTTLDGPTVALGASVNKAALDSYGGSATSSVTDARQFNYHAAPGSAQLSSEEELFAAVGRSRFAW